MGAIHRLAAGQLTRYREAGGLLQQTLTFKVCLIIHIGELHGQRSVLEVWFSCSS